MVKHLLGTILNYARGLFLLLPLFLFSGEFTASVNRNQIGMGENLILTLTLKEASPQGSPSIEDLKHSFVIHAQQQGSNIMMTNGRISTSTTWKMTLSPQREGETTIPPIEISTSEGTLASAPIQINVAQGNPHNSDNHELVLTSDLSKAKPYKNEPVFYTIRLNSQVNLANIKVQKLNMDDAIVEPNGEPKVYKKVVDGMQVDVIELNYLITPLKAGALKIPSVVIQGSMPMRRQSSGSFFDDFEPFFMMPGFERLTPFTMTSKETLLDVQPAATEVTPWLPAQSLKIEEVWDDSQTLQAGEPIIRGIKIAAEGTMSSQLPSLSDLQINDNSFKIYADKPEMGDEIKDGRIQSFRKEQYTLIPQQTGTLTLPEISIAWWDVNKQERIVATLPSRTLQIVPAPENANSEIAFIDETKLNAPTSSTNTINAIQRNPLLCAFMAGLVILLLGAILWVIALQRKIARLVEPVSMKNVVKHAHSEPQLRTETKVIPPKKDRKEKLPDLNPT